MFIVHSNLSSIKLDKFSGENFYEMDQLKIKFNPMSKHCQSKEIKVSEEKLK